MTKNEILDLYFIEIRHKLVEIAAFLDRLERGTGAADFRLAAFRAAIRELDQPGSDAAERVLLAFSDPTVEPIPAATTQGACGAWGGEKDKLNS